MTSMTTIIVIVASFLAIGFIVFLLAGVVAACMLSSKISQQLGEDEYSLYLRKDKPS